MQDMPDKTFEDANSRQPDQAQDDDELSQGPTFAKPINNGAG
jgi:hypothetical protein